MEKEEKALEVLSEEESLAKSRRDKEVAATVSFSMSIVAYVLGGILGIVFSVIALVFNGRAKDVKKTSYRAFKSLGLIFGIVSLIKSVFDILIFCYIFVNYILQMFITIPMIVLGVGSQLIGVISAMI